MDNFLEKLINVKIFNTSTFDIAVFITIFICSSLLIKIALGTLKKLLSNLSKKTKNNLDDLAVIVLDKTNPIFIYSLAFIFAVSYLKISSSLSSKFQTTFICIAIIQAAIWASNLLALLIPRIVNKGGESEDSQNFAALELVNFSAKAIIWIFALLLILDNFGVDITALIAGLGVGGIAVALAVQNILSDLLASLSIILDKPFVVGDFIVIDELAGNVEKIGFKTTRIRSLNGEQLILSNSDLLSSRIKNFKKLYERRVVFNLTLTYQTALDKLKDIPQIIEEIINKQTKVRFDRANFKSFGDSALIFENVYFVLDSDYKVYMSTQEKINLEIFDKFAQLGIEFAYPTQTVFVSTCGNSSAQAA